MPRSFVSALKMSRSQTYTAARFPSLMVMFLRYGSEVLVTKSFVTLKSEHVAARFW